MRIEKLAKDADSNPDSCQVVYLAEDGRFGGQGDLVNASTRCAATWTGRGDHRVPSGGGGPVGPVRHLPVLVVPLGGAGGSGEDAALAAFRTGEPIPLSPALGKWTQMLRQRVSSGCVAQRVHVVASPLTDYMCFELASYAPNVEAGEDVRLIPVPSDGPWPEDVPRDDFWLIDSSELWSQRYDPEGTWLGVELVTDTGQIVKACLARDAALRQSLPWADYLQDNHPEITSYLAATAGRP